MVGHSSFKISIQFLKVVLCFYALNVFMFQAGASDDASDALNGVRLSVCPPSSEEYGFQQRPEFRRLFLKSIQQFRFIKTSQFLMTSLMFLTIPTCRPLLQNEATGSIFLLICVIQ